MVTIKTQRGLGRGLSALISENYTQPAAPAASSPAEELEPVAAENGTQTISGASWGARDLPIGMIVPGKFQPRMRFNEDNLQELAASIRANGIMQPIVVRQVTTAWRETYEIVAGERRWRAAKIAGLNTVPAVVRDLTDQQALELALIENVQRADLSPLEEANGYQRLLEEFGYTQEELAGVVGKSRSHIANLLRLIGLPEEIKSLLEEGSLSMGHARALIGMPAEQSMPIARAIVEKGLSVRQAEQLSRTSQGMPERSQPRPRSSSPSSASRTETGPKDPDIVALEGTLSESLGLRVTINNNGQSGELVIAYESLTDLDHALKRLSGGM